MTPKPTGLAILLGAGPTTGAGIARILASPSHGNLAVALLSRTASPALAASLAASSDGGTLHAFQSDTSAPSLARAFAEIRAHEPFAGLPLTLAIWNVKHSHRVPFDAETSERFDDSLRVYVGGARNFAAECTKWMLSQQEQQPPPPPQPSTSTSTANDPPAPDPTPTSAPASASASAPEGLQPMTKKGTLIFTGTLGALRSNAQYAAYGAGRAGVRMLAQSLAREYSGRGLHVVHAIANGGITDTAADEAGEAGDKVRAGTRMRAESVGQTYLWLSRQQCDLWVHELDMRPAAEKF